MGRDLNITYFPDSETANLATNGYSDENYEAREKGVKYSDISANIGCFRNVSIDTFRGSQSDLETQIKELRKEAQNAENNDGYLTIGFFCIVLAEWPYGCDWVVIEND